MMPTAEAVVAVNQYICEEGGNPHHCYDVGKIESAIFTAFYPGSHPFAHGGVASIAGAMCFYLVKSHAFMDGNKRTGALVAITFMNQHGLDLVYELEESKNVNGLADTIEKCAADAITKEDLMAWFDQHQVKI